MSAYRTKLELPPEPRSPPSARCPVNGNHMWLWMDALRQSYPPAGTDIWCGYCREESNVDLLVGGHPFTPRDPRACWPGDGPGWARRLALRAHAALIGFVRAMFDVEA